MENRLITFTEFAQRCGVSVQSISRAVRSGRLAVTMAGDNRKKLWESQIEEYKSQVFQPSKGTNYQAPPKAESNAIKQYPSMSDSRAVREAYAAKTAELKYKEFSGSLVQKKVVEMEAFRIGRMVREQISAMPDRLAAELAAETNMFKVHKILSDEIRRVFEALKELGGASDGVVEHEASGV